MRVKIIKLEKYAMGTYGLNDNIGKVLEARDVGVRDVFEVIFPANEPIRLFVAKEELVVINPNTEIILKYLEENNWKDYFYNSTARLYTYEQLYSIAKHINLKNRSLYIKSGLIEKLNELYFGKEKKEEKKPVPPYTEADAIKLCVPKNRGFTAFYSVVYEHKHYTGQNTACHAGLKNAKYYADSAGAGKLVAIADYPEYRCKINGDSKRYADYIVNRSAFAKAFKTKDYDGKALLMNIQECSHNFIVIACIALRASTEFLDMCKSWCYLVDQGIDEHKAYFLSYFFNKAYSDAVLNHHPYMSGSHRIFEGGICSIQDFAALVKGEFVDKDKPCAEEFKSYYSVSNHYSGDGNYSLNSKWLYEKLGKVGTINDTLWATNYEIKGHKDLLKACKNFDW